MIELAKKEKEEVLSISQEFIRIHGEIMTIEETIKKMEIRSSELIQELEVFNSVIKDSVKTRLFTLIVSLVVGLIFIILEPTLLVVSFYGIISLVILTLLFRKDSSLNKFNKVIDFLQQNM